MNRDVCGICWCPYDDNGACGCKTLDDAMRLPRAMAQAYENGYKAGAAAEREACAKVCYDKANETFSGHCQVWGDYFARAIERKVRGEE